MVTSLLPDVTSSDSTKFCDKENAYLQSKRACKVGLLLFGVFLDNVSGTAAYFEITLSTRSELRARVGAHQRSSETGEAKNMLSLENHKQFMMKMTILRLP